MVLKMSASDSIDDLPSANRLMNPEFFAVSKEYGVPAEGSVVAVGNGNTLIYKGGQWAPAFIPMPVKGDLIMLDGNQYRVLKINDTVAEVLCMYDATDSLKFDTNSYYTNTYAGRNIDTFCNDTFYSSLSSAIKSAIIDKTFTQDSWKSSLSVPAESHYTAKYAYGKSLYYLSLEDATFGESITRHSYCLSIQDVVDYLESTTAMTEDNTTLTGMNIWKMVWNQSEPTSNNIWLRSADVSKSYYVFYIQYNNGGIRNYDTRYTCAVRPAFQIDLSKVDWTKSE